MQGGLPQKSGWGLKKLMRSYASLQRKNDILKNSNIGGVFFMFFLLGNLFWLKHYKISKTYNYTNNFYMSLHLKSVHVWCACQNYADLLGIRFLEVPGYPSEGSLGTWWGRKFKIIFKNLWAWWDDSIDTPHDGYGQQSCTSWFLVSCHQTPKFSPKYWISRGHCCVGQNSSKTSISHSLVYSSTTGASDGLL